jgi:pyridoxine 5-phosphate synthase
MRTVVVRLSVNVNKIATLRNARGGDRPNVLHAARTCVEAGCHGITVHPRPDGRHIRYEDVETLAVALPVELNVEGYPSPELLALVCRLRPAQCTLVPDAPDALTSSAGWRLDDDDTPGLARAVGRLRGAGIRVSLFLDPMPDRAARAEAIGADRIELYTEAYARAWGTPALETVYARYRATAEAAVAVGLGVNAGHDLDLENLPYLATTLPGLLEVSIGHALVSDALYLGLRATVAAYLGALRGEVRRPPG